MLIIILQFYIITIYINKGFIIYNKLNVYTINVGYSLRSLCVGRKIFLGRVEGVDAIHGRGVYTRSCFRNRALVWMSNDNMCVYA